MLQSKRKKVDKLGRAYNYSMYLIKKARNRLMYLWPVTMKTGLFFFSCEINNFRKLKFFY